MKIVQIKIDGSMDDIDISLNHKNIENTLKNLSSYNGYEKIKELYTWSYNEWFIYCYGWYDGELNFKNIHSLMPCGNSKFLDIDSSEINLYGDIFLIKKIKNKYNPFCTTEYAEISEYFNEFNYDFYINNVDHEINKNNDESLDEHNIIHSQIVFKNAKQKNDSNQNKYILEIDENNYIE